MRKKLTTKTIDALPPAKGKRYEVRDTVLPGLHIRVSATGAKVWYLATRVEGRMRRIKLGAYPVISLSDARQRAQGILRDIALGKFTESAPGSPETPTLGNIIPQFIDRHAKRHTKDWKGTQSVLLRMKKLHGKPIDQIKRADVVRELEAMIADIEKTGGKGTRANRGLAAIKKLYSWCIDQGYVEISPVAALKPLIKEVARDRWLTDDEIKSFWRGCETEGYLRRDLDENGHEADQDFRVLSRMKANFAPRQDAIDLVWRDGVFVVNDPINDRPAVADIDRKLIDEVARAFDAGTPWSAHHQAGHRHLVPWIATNLKQSRNAAKAMLARLLVEGSIIEAVTDAHHHRKGLCTPEQAAKQLRNKEVK